MNENYIRDAILAELDRREWSKYRLALLAEPHGIKPRGLYKWLAGHGRMLDDRLSIIVTLLELELKKPAR